MFHFIWNNHGGGIIKRLKIGALFLALGLSLCILTLAGGVNDQEPSTVKVNEKSTGNDVIEVNAAYKTHYKKVVHYKRVYSKGKYRYVKAYRYVKSYKYVKKTHTTYSDVAIVTTDSDEATILRSAARYRYSGAAHDGTAMEKNGAGDCWAMSDYLQTKFTKAGIKSRIVQYSNAYSSRHRSVQLFQNNKWLDVPYKQYGINQMFSAQSSKPGIKVITG